MAMIKRCSLKLAVCQLLDNVTSSRALVNGMRKRAAQHNGRALIAVKPNCYYAQVTGLHGDEPNDNGDYFRWRDTLLAKNTDGAYAFETWRDKPNLLNHNKNLRVGTIIDVWPIFGEKAIEFLLETEKREAQRKEPLLIEALERGKPVTASMGVWVTHSLCSVCGNEAKTEDEWCDHLKYHKGRKDPKTGQRVYEDNRGITGMELSWVTVGAPADQKATLRRVVASKSIIDLLED